MARTADCPFCSLTRGRLLFDDEPEELRVRVFRDAYPVAEGHTLVVPVRHVPTYFDATPELQARLWRAVDIAKTELDQEFGPDGYNVGFNAGAAAGQTVDHLHIHVIPRRHGDMADPRGGIRGVIPSRQKYGADARQPRVVAGGKADPLYSDLIPLLDGATQVDLAVGFLFATGVDMLEPRLVEVLRRPGARIRILTGDYQGVTEPDALRQLLQLPDKARAADFDANLMLKLYEVRRDQLDSFHPKVWLVGHPSRLTAWIGSSNMSKRALRSGLEWSYRIVDPEELSNVSREFEALWNHGQAKPVDDAKIDAYAKRRKPLMRGGKLLVVADAEDPRLEVPQPRPGVQQEALFRLEQTRAAGNKSGLVVLATGLGKTYLSAFDSNRPEFRRVLFVAHREEILRQAFDSFQRVRRGQRLGFYNGSQKDETASVLFASIQTLSSLQHLERFDTEHFDYIIIDEFHHAAASTYRRLINYFTPRFLLGLTATPDRSDGANLLTLCDGNLVYRADIVRGIRDAQLAPFHYFGIPDDTRYEPIPWRNYTDAKLAETVSTVERARRVLETLRKHTTPRVRALGFCVTKTHAQFMADQFRGWGIDCAAVYDGSQDLRIPTLERLARGELEIVFCVDMFNEGVDVPNIDTVLMLRPTQSFIIWMQQLGRGLRFQKGKTLMVLDYIGNHQVFSNRPEMLVKALGLEGKNAVEALLDGPSRPGNLPPGVVVNFELETKNVLEQLRKRSKRAGTKAERWYRQFYELRGRRPTALEARDAGYFKDIRKRKGSWFSFVEAEGHLDHAAAAAFSHHRSFVDGVETQKLTKSYKILILAALIELDALAKRVSKQAIAERICARARRSAAIMRDLSQDGRDASAIRRLLDKDAFPRLAMIAGDQVFVNTRDHFDGSALSSDHVEALVPLIQELLDYHLTHYLDDANKSSIKLPQMRGRSGELVDARFNVEDVDGRTTLVFHSRGGSGDKKTNSEYRLGLELLFERLARIDPPVRIMHVAVDTSYTRDLPLAKRIVAVTGHDYPLKLARAIDHRAFADELRKQARSIGQAPGATRGNRTRTLRITLSEQLPGGEIWRHLQGPR